MKLSSIFYALLCLVFITLFVTSTIKETRRFRNGVYLLLALFTGFEFLSIAFHNDFFLRALFIVTGYVLLPTAILVVAVCFILAGIKAIQREGARLPNFLSIALGICFIAITAVNYYMIINGVDSVLQLFSLLGGWLVFTFTAFVLYAHLYCMFPKHVKKCQYIIVHGAGLLHGDGISPLLKKRIDKGVQIYLKTGKKAKIILSGGKGKDEAMSEAEAMAEYLYEKKIPKESIILEDHSTTTLENIVFSKRIIESLDPHYKSCIFVTNNYHIFRASIYARTVGLRGQGVGCNTAFYYWPNACIREYIAVLSRYRWTAILSLAIIIMCWAFANYGSMLNTYIK